MHIKRVEEYSFSHGLNRDSTTGKFLPLQPHTFGRPLTHDEMDYNMRYMEQTLGGYKIFGSNDDTTLSEEDIDKSLILHRITPVDTDYARYVAGGYFADNELIWIPGCCGDGGSGQSCDINIAGYTLSQQQATSGQQDVNITIFVNGLQGPPSFLINGVSATPSSTNGNQYTFNGYGAGTYSIIVTDTGVTDYTCDDNITIVITEAENPCDGFSLLVTTNASGGEGDPILCELQPDDLSISSITQPIEFGSSDGWVELLLSGSWTDSSQLQFTFDGEVKTPTPQSANGPVFRFENLSAETYSIYVVDLAANTFCWAFLTIEIESQNNPCDGFSLVVTTNPSGGEDLDCGNFVLEVATNPSGGVPEACVGFGVDISTVTSGGISQLPPPSICQDFQISLSSNQTGIYVTLPEGTWGDLTFQYSTTDPSDPSTIFTDAEDVISNQDGTFLLSGYASGDIWIRVEESNNQCTDIEMVTINS